MALHLVIILGFNDRYTNINCLASELRAAAALVNNNIVCVLPLDGRNDDFVLADFMRGEWATVHLPWPTKDHSWWEADGMHLSLSGLLELIPEQVDAIADTLRMGAGEEAGEVLLLCDSSWIARERAPESEQAPKEFYYQQVGYP